MVDMPYNQARVQALVAHIQYVRGTEIIASYPVKRHERYDGVSDYEEYIVFDSVEQAKERPIFVAVVVYGSIRQVIRFNDGDWVDKIIAEQRLLLDDSFTPYDQLDKGKS